MAFRWSRRRATGKLLIRVVLLHLGTCSDLEDRIQKKSNLEACYVM